MDEGPGRELFGERVGATLSLLDGEGGEVAALRLAGIQDYGDEDGRRFSVLFHGLSEAFLPQATYRARIEGRAEPFDLFLVPVARTPEGFEYEAAFNRTV